MAEKRLLHELKEQTKVPSPAVDYMGLVDDNIFHWEATLIGPVGTPYEGGKWKIDIQIPERYPLLPPVMTFKTKIAHPNIKFETGEICMDILKDEWTPAWTIRTVIMALQSMLTTPEPDSPLNIDAANLVRSGEDKGYEQLVQYYTKIYAS